MPPIPPIPPLVPDGAQFTFGKSPFRVKGILYEGTQSFFNKTVTEGMQLLISTIGPGPLADFIGQRFLPSSWYDVMPVPALIAFEARSLGMGLEEYLLHRTQWQANRDSGGVYRVLLKLVSPDYVMARLPKVLTQMFEFADYEIDVLGPKHRLISIKGVPRPLQQWFRFAIKVYAEHLIGRAGGKQPKVDLLRPRHESDRGGLAIETLLYEIKWS